MREWSCYIMGVVGSIGSYLIGLKLGWVGGDERDKNYSWN